MEKVLEECDRGVDRTWKRSSIGSLLETIIDYRGKTPPKSPAGIPLISAANVKAGRVDLSDPEFISLENYKTWARRGFTNPGDVLITTEAPAGEVAPYPRDGIYQISRRVMALRPDPRQLDSTYLLYALLWKDVNQKLLSYSRGTTVPRVLKTDITNLVIPVPPLPEQKAIAHILGTLDDKIELNRRMNETLEEMARALFKSWFVDFDPVRAKMDGREPAGMSADVAALFPDKLVHVNGELVPEGWSKGSVGNLATIKHGFAFKGEFFKSEPAGYVLLTPGNFQIGGGFKGDKFKFYDGPIDGDYVLMANDLLVTMTDLSKLGDTLGYPAFVPRSAEHTYLHNQRLGKVEIGSRSKIGAEYLYQVFCLPSYRHHILGSATGSTVKHTSPTRIGEFESTIPSKEIAQRFDAIANSFRQRLQANGIEITRLSQIRDALLPQLLSGEIRIPVAEKFVQDNVA